jgi:hypothetical protein
LLFSAIASTLELIMKGASILLLAAAAGAGTFAFARPAAALGPIDLELAARGGFGWSPVKNSGVNPLGVGLGGRAGIGIFSIYAGIEGAYYFGQGSEQVPIVSPTGQLGTARATASSYLYGIEAGYNFNILFLTIRPTIGVGNYTIHTKVEGVGTGDAHSVYIEPRATALIGIGIWEIGTDIAVFLPPGLQGWKAGAMWNGQIGLKF